MKLVRVVFEREVPSPSALSISRTNWCSTFSGAHLQITREGDAVRITDSETRCTFLYPWASVAAAEPMPPEALPPPAPIVHTKRARS